MAHQLKELMSSLQQSGFDSWGRELPYVVNVAKKKCPKSEDAHFTASVHADDPLLFAA